MLFFPRDDALLLGADEDEDKGEDEGKDCCSAELDDDSEGGDDEDDNNGKGDDDDNGDDDNDEEEDKEDDDKMAVEGAVESRISFTTAMCIDITFAASTGLLAAFSAINCWRA